MKKKKKKTLFKGKFHFNYRDNLLKLYIWSTVLKGAGIWALWKDQKHLEKFGMGCRRRMEKISWDDRVKNYVVLHRVNEDRNVLNRVKQRNVNRIGYILRRNYLLKYAIEGKVKGRIEMTGRQGTTV